MITRLTTLFAATLIAAATGAASASEPELLEVPSFRNDVMPVLAKAGCNMGTCHGNLHGKGGFKLSLRGQHPDADYLALTREQVGRRVNRLEPAGSLILLKPTAAVAHEGGKRFEKGSVEHEILRRWIAAGVPDDSDDAPRVTELNVTPTEAVLVEPQTSVQFSVSATFSDGTTRDVTRLAVYEPANLLATASPEGTVHRNMSGESIGETTVLVRFLEKQVPVRIAFVIPADGFTSDAPPPSNYIDEHIFAKLRTLRMNPSPLADDHVFVRRAYLDLLGMVPSAAEARAFVSDQSPDKRAKLIDALLARPEFADYWAIKWADLLRIEEKTLDTTGVEVFHGWVRDAIATGMPMDRFARELIAARGSTYKVPPTNFYRALRDPVTRAEAVAQVFLGTRMQCAKCHNHPFEKWTQDDYYGFAANFARIDYDIVENKRKDKFDKHQFIGEQIVKIADKGEVKDPRNNKPAKPRFLGRGDAPRDDDQDRLEALAGWLASADNELFAKVQVNRIWSHLMGRGLVDPVDDFRATNPASHPELLDELANDFIASGFDLRHMIRTIMLSRSYQLSGEPNATNEHDRVNYSRAIVRRLTAEQVLDSMSAATGVATPFNGYDMGTRAAQVPGAQREFRNEGTDGDLFLKMFGKPDRLLNCDCERSNETTLGQVFEFAGGPTIHRKLSADENVLTRMLSQQMDDATMLEELYWATLSRPPSEKEREAMLQYVNNADDYRTAFEDVMWSLLNAKEFLFRR